MPTLPASMVPSETTTISFGLIDHVLDEGCEPSIPILFLMMARKVTASVSATPHASREDAWTFRIDRRAVVHIDEAGRLEWPKTPPPTLRRLDVLLETARSRHARISWRPPACEADPAAT